jgi:hypothetical protein
LQSYFGTKTRKAQARRSGVQRRLATRIQAIDDLSLIVLS